VRERSLDGFEIVEKCCMVFESDTIRKRILNGWSYV
jgi:hypothetical protein